jgi:Uma2 family endonuclease
MSVIPLQHEIYYPESDGQPMGETTAHAAVMRDVITALEVHFEDDPDVYVGGNQFLYYVQGDPRQVICPDVTVTRGIPKKPPRRTYQLWVEGKPPCLVVEVTSASTRGEDLGKKKSCYERMGVEDYFLYDPFGEYLNPSLQGFRLVDGRYRKIRPDLDGSLPTWAIGLKLKVVEERLRLVDAEGNLLPSGSELGPALKALRAETAARQEAEAALQDEIAACQAADERVRALEEEIARLRAERS